MTEDYPLSKHVCQRCYARYRPRHPWRKRNDQDWENGYVYCPYKLSNGIASSTAKLPCNYCPFAAEHIAEYAASVAT